MAKNGKNGKKIWRTKKVMSDFSEMEKSIFFFVLKNAFKHVFTCFWVKKNCFGISKTKNSGSTFLKKLKKNLKKNLKIVICKGWKKFFSWFFSFFGCCKMLLKTRSKRFLRVFENLNFFLFTWNFFQKILKSKDKKKLSKKWSSFYMPNFSSKKFQKKLLTAGIVR